GLELENPAPFREIEVRKAVSVNGLARSAGITRDQFLDWNPAIGARARNIPAGYRVKLPADGKPQRNLQVAQRITEKTVQVRHHRVKRGETIAQIARRYGASVERILQLNGIRRANLLQVGALLLIPRS
ncbi:MAG: LysM peptidoglycan-binding domain-containing protein, partial [Deltaproteobacteria bacterium]|nr:LysM peptidoglycan-binding domain-containing protein [Deltaproteobacteria bacterium]